MFRNGILQTIKLSPNGSFFAFASFVIKTILLQDIVSYLVGDVYLFIFYRECTVVEKNNKHPLVTTQQIIIEELLLVPNGCK